MRSILWLSGLSLAALTACAAPEGTGFSGIGSEPQVTSSPTYFNSSYGGTQPGISDTSYGHLKDSVPQLNTRTKSSDPGYNAEAAVLAAKSKNRLGQPVQLNGEDLMLSVVWVNKVSYAVLRPTKSTMRSDTSQLLLSNAVALTGCPAASAVHTQDNRRKRDGVQGMSMQISCSSI